MNRRAFLIRHVLLAPPIHLLATVNPPKGISKSVWLDCLEEPMLSLHVDPYEALFCGLNIAVEITLSPPLGTKATLKIVKPYATSKRKCNPIF